MYAAEARVCAACAMKNRCTSTSRRWITRHLPAGALQRMDQRATAKLMRLRRCTVGRTVRGVEARDLGKLSLPTSRPRRAQAEISLATLTCNLKTMFHALGGYKLLSDPLNWTRCLANSHPSQRK